MRRFARISMLVAAASAALALAGPFALVPFKDAAGAATDVSVAFVVDFGGANKVQATCVQVPSSDNEYQALALFTQQEQEESPSYNNSGLLCSIGGMPGSGCGQSDGKGFIYWSYWHGDTGTWEYSNTGASATVHSCNTQGEDCDVEGWRFEDPGSGNPNDPPPDAAADFADICAATPPPTTTTLSPPTTLVGSTMPSDSDPSATKSSPSSGGTTHQSATRTTESPGGRPQSTAPKSTSPTTIPKTPTTPVHHAVSLPNTAASTTTTTTEPNVKIQALGGIPAGGEHGSSGGSGSVWSAGGILLILIAGSLYGWRRRVRPP